MSCLFTDSSQHHDRSASGPCGHHRLDSRTIEPDAEHRFLQVEDRNELPLQEVTIAEMLALPDIRRSSRASGIWAVLDTCRPIRDLISIMVGDTGDNLQPDTLPVEESYLQEHHDGEFITERLTEESVAFLKSHDPSRPFFCFCRITMCIRRFITSISFDHFEQKRNKFGTDSSPIAERRGISRTRRITCRVCIMVSAIDDSVGADYSGDSGIRTGRLDDDHLHVGQRWALHAA